VRLSHSASNGRKIETSECENSLKVKNQLAVLERTREQESVRGEERLRRWLGGGYKPRYADSLIFGLSEVIEL
jgi:hypothetical protein